MSRVYYDDDGDNWAYIRYGGALKSALRGKPGQQVLRDMRDALVALPKRRLGKDALCNELGDYCAWGAYAHHRGVSRTYLEKLSDWRADDRCFDRGGPILPRVALEGEEQVEWVKERFGVTFTLAFEVMIINEGEDRFWETYTPEQRYQRVMRWLDEHIREPQS